MTTNNLAERFGNIDIYLFDQLLKGRYDHCRKIIDIGCGGGRNSVYFLQNGFDVYGIDQDPNAISTVKALSKKIAPDKPTENFVVAKIEDIPFDTSSFDLVICQAILHFANDPAHFEKMLAEVWRVLKPGGFLFARLASDIGIETLVQSISASDRRYLLPDGTERFLVNDAMLKHYTKELKAEFYEPIKTTNVNNIRSMTTWCIRKG